MKICVTRTFLTANLLLLTLTGYGYGANDEISVLDTSTESLYSKRGLWFVPARAGGKSVVASFSTRSNCVAVNAPNLNRDFPELIIEPGSDPSHGSVFFADLPFSCLDLPERKVSAGGMNLTDFSKMMRVPLGAVAGINYLRRYAFVLDPKSAKISSLQSPVLSAQGLAMEITWQKELPCIPVTLPGLGSRAFCLHTSQGGALALTSERIGLLMRMGHLKELRSDGTKFQVTDGKRSDRPAPSTFVLRWVDLGEIRFHNVNVEVGERDSVGLTLLQYFRTTIDFPENKVWLERLSTDNEIRLSTRCQGPDIEFHETNQLVVSGSVDGFRLADHGLASGDYVTAINAISYADLSIWKVGELLSEPGSTISLEVQRGEMQFTTKIPLKHSFEWPPNWPPERVAFDP